MQVEYLGHCVICVGTTGIHPTEKKVTAIKEAPVPTDASQLRAFIGLMNYYGKFIPHISTELVPFHKLYYRKNKNGLGVRSVKLLFVNAKHY